MIVHDLDILCIIWKNLAFRFRFDCLMWSESGKGLMVLALLLGGPRTVNPEPAN